MFSIIVSIFAVLLTAAIAVASVYYGGSNINTSSGRALAEQLVNDGEQLTSSGALYQNDHAGNLPATPVALAPDYLSRIPLPPQAVYAAGAGTASTNDWAYLSGSANIILQKLSKNACLAVNQLYGISGIPSSLDSRYLIQCFGQKEPYVFFFDPPGGNMKTAATESQSLFCPTTPVVLNFTGGAQTLTVPGGCSSMTAKLWGGGGAPTAPNTTYISATYAGGGGYATGTLPVSPGMTFNVLVGGAGQYSTGGYNGGGASTKNEGGGGGATEIRKTDGTRLLVAGGGGGAGADRSAGAGGGTSGQSSNAGDYSCYGGGGSQTQGGYANYGGAATGGWLTGGTTNYGGGGGGGYYGGGGGCNDTGGGGGSSYIGGMQNGSTLAGNYSNPGNASDADRHGAGAGGSGWFNMNTGGFVLTPGTSGIVVVYFK